MKSHEEYLQELETYSKGIISSTKVRSTRTKGTLWGLQSFLESYETEIKNVSDKVSRKASDLLNESKTDTQIDSSKMKEDLTKTANDLVTEFINRTNKEFKNG